MKTKILITRKISDVAEEKLKICILKMICISIKKEIKL